MKYIDNLLKQKCMLSDQAPAYRDLLKKKALTKKDKDAQQEIEVQDDDTVDKRLIALDQIHPFDIDSFSVDEGAEQNISLADGNAPPAGNSIDYTARKQTQQIEAPHGIEEEDGDGSVQMEGGEQSEI